MIRARRHPVESSSVETTPERWGARRDGVAVPGGTSEGTDDTFAYKAALAWIGAQGGGTLICSPGRYMVDLPDLDQLIFNGSNITLKGVPGQTVLDFSRTEGWYNGATGTVDYIKADLINGSGCNVPVDVSAASHNTATANL